MSKANQRAGGKSRNRKALTATYEAGKLYVQAIRSITGTNQVDQKLARREYARLCRKYKN